MTNPPDLHAMGSGELELHIQHCIDLMEECHRQGNPEAALGWKQALDLAQKARELSGQGCYFTNIGDAHRVALAGNSA